MVRSGFLAMNERGSVTYHCVSRVVDRAYKFGDKEKAVFVKIMRQMECFCGVEVLSYCVMSNHFHLLVRVAKSEGGVGAACGTDDIELEDGEFERRLLALYKADEVEVVMRSLQKCRRNKAVKMARQIKQRFTYRMGDISEFMKSLKQRFARWYNKANGRSGTLWENRYSVTYVGPGWATKVVAAYIDLNPLRAGIVKDPADYRYCSYSEAVCRGGLARQRLLSVMKSSEEGATLGPFSPSNHQDAMTQYRVLLADEGAAVDTNIPLQEGDSKRSRKKKTQGFSSSEVKRILKQGGKLSLRQLLRCKARYFTSGFAIGSRDYMEKVLTTLGAEGELFERRKMGSALIRHAEELELRSLRNLQKSAVIG